MADADSQQRSLILAALAEIGTRTLKPMNRALAVSMQDESPDVRKNAIRDLTRVYETMTQISQMLSMAAQDEDPEVQENSKVCNFANESHPCFTIRATRNSNSISTRMGRQRRVNSYELGVMS